MDNTEWTNWTAAVTVSLLDDWTTPNGQHRMDELDSRGYGVPKVNDVVKVVCR